MIKFSSRKEPDIENKFLTLEEIKKINEYFSRDNLLVFIISRIPKITQKFKDFLEDPLEKYSPEGIDEKYYIFLIRNFYGFRKPPSQIDFYEKLKFFYKNGIDEALLTSANQYIYQPEYSLTFEKQYKILINNWECSIKIKNIALNELVRLHRISYNNKRLLELLNFLKKMIASRKIDKHNKNVVFCIGIVYHKLGQYFKAENKYLKILMHAKKKGLIYKNTMRYIISLYDTLFQNGDIEKSNFVTFINLEFPKGCINIIPNIYKMIIKIYNEKIDFIKLHFDYSPFDYGIGGKGYIKAKEDFNNRIKKIK
jgi:tetratricopeptide (TPR) repeat protein